MNFKQFGMTFMLLAGFLAWGCQNTQEAEQGETTPDTEAPAEESQMTQGSLQGDAATAEVTDEELRQFLAAAQYIQMVSQQAQQQMISAVEGEGLTVERFTQIQQAEQAPGQESDATEDEMALYENAMTALDEIQQETQQQMLDKIEEEGLTGDRYQQINMALQMDTSLQQKFQVIQQEMMGE